MRIKDLASRLISKCSPALFFKIAYIHNRHKFPNLNNPNDLSELWIRKVLRGDNLRDFILADKYEVREYVRNSNLEDILVPLLGVWDNPDDIDFDILPNKFAIKMNYGAGMNIIVTDKAKLNMEKIRSQLRIWLTQNKSYSNSERHYSLINRKIIAERFIEDGNRGFPCDYKFMCINGKVHCILAVSGREHGHGEYLPYSIDWKPLYNYYKITPPKLINKPKNLERMIEIAQQLAHNTDLIRIDLYSDGDKVWFGEITLTPSGCIFHRWTQYALDKMGEVYFESL